jgi:hypothetical protein
MKLLPEFVIFECALYVEFSEKYKKVAILEVFKTEAT